jgi:hypothetical protein
MLEGQSFLGVNCDEYLLAFINEDSLQTLRLAVHERGVGVLAGVDSVGEEGGVFLGFKCEGVQGGYLKCNDFNFDWFVDGFVESKIISIVVNLFVFSELL